MKNLKKGFTVIELVIVISVLIILIGIAIPRMKGMQQAGYVAKVRGELQTLQSAMESYYNFAVTPHAYISTTATPCASYFTGTSPQIVTSPLYDPFAASTTTEYISQTTTNGLYYAFASVGPAGNAAVLTVSSSNGATTTNTGNLCVTNGTGC